MGLPPRAIAGVGGACAAVGRARRRGPRGRVCRVISTSAGKPQERAPWTRERLPWLFHPCRLGRENLCFGGTMRVRGRTWPGVVGGPFGFGRCPDHSNRPPWIWPPAGPILFLSHIPYLVAWHVCLEPILVHAR
jgi:hypothetical protein